MALAATTVLETRTGGSDTNGGGFNSAAAGEDHSRQDAAEIAVADAVTNGTTTITSVSGLFTVAADVVGNVLYIAGGTGSITADRYEIKTRVSDTEITVDRSTGLTAGTGVTVNVGGALATPGELGNVLDIDGVAGMKAHIKSGTYSLSTSTPNTSGGPCHLPTAAEKYHIIGYETTREDGGAKPVLDSNAQTGVTLWLTASSSSSNPQILENLKADGQDGASTIGFSLAVNNRNNAKDCEAVDCPTGFTGGTSLNCLATGCATKGFAGAGDTSATGCTATTCAIGFGLTGDDVTLARCLAHANTGDGFAIGSRVTVDRCTAQGNGGDGFQASANSTVFLSCLSVSNTGYGFNTAASSMLFDCATHNNTSGATNTAPFILGNTALSGDPFENQAGDDFRPNNTAGAGAVLRAGAIGVPGQTTNLDIGAVQHEDPAGGGAASILGGGQLTGGFST